jgi:hypothetical protein
MKVTKAYKSVRRSWGELNPVTRVVKSKAVYRRRDKFKNTNRED